VPRALAARPWATDDRVVLEVDAAQGHAAGRFVVTTAGGTATVSPATDTDDTDVALSAETLGSLYLGGVAVLQLHRAGRLAGTDDAVRRWAAMADLSEPPYCLTGF
jgi:predicted acetyltransferase